jgi:hypothetical protein
MPRIFHTLRLACRLLSTALEGGSTMGWLDAHESYVMEIITRERVDELRSTVDVVPAHTERASAPAARDPDVRRRPAAAAFVCSHALTEAPR